MSRIERAMEIVSNDEMLGICTNCGNEQAAEPDAREHICEKCGMARVKGAEEFLIDSF